MIKDPVLKSFFKDFADNFDFEIQNLREDLLFEKFVNYCVVSRLYPRDFEIDDLSTGGENDIGIDGIAIIVNGNIITDESEIDYFVQQNGALNVKFILIQSKNSSNFDGGQVGSFLFGVKTLFDDTSNMPENDKIQKVRAIKDKLYDNSIDFEILPELKLYFATTGEWKNPVTIKERTKRELKEITDKKIFSKDPSIDFIDAEKLKTFYRELKRKVIKEISFPLCVAIPEFIDQELIKQAWIGCVSVKDYLSLVENDDGTLAHGLFYDNVRDFQGKSSVNGEIDKTLKSTEEQNLLPLLNNGITIIAKKIEKIGTKIKLSDFQIVNGCQTTNILYSNKNNVSPETNIVIKIIETENKDVTDKIIRATNRQTEVKEEAFESLKSFHRNLQEFYKAKSEKIQQPIFYERRSKEFVGDSKIKPIQVITLSFQIKAYISTVLAQPQSTHRYFGELLTSNSGKMFNTNDNYNDYYYSALLVKRISLFYKKAQITVLSTGYKYHIALVVYRQTKKLITKEFTYDNLIEKTNDTEWLLKEVKDACKYILNILKKSRYFKVTRNKDFTNAILEGLI